MPLDVAQQRDGAREVLAVTGDLDLETAPTLVSAAFALIELGTRDIIVNASELQFCDSSGLSAFVRIANRLEPDGGRLAIVAPHPIVSRVLEISGLVEAFVVADDLAAAVARLDQPAEH